MTTTDNRPYFLKLKDPRWQKKRLKILERDNFTCRDTGKKDEPLEVHHCHYFKGEPWDTPDEFLLTLCESAHKQRQEKEKEIKNLVGKILTKLSSDEEYWNDESDPKHTIDDFKTMLDGFYKDEISTDFFDVIFKRKLGEYKNWDTRHRIDVLFWLIFVICEIIEVIKSNRECECEASAVDPEPIIMSRFVKREIDRSMKSLFESVKVEGE